MIEPRPVKMQLVSPLYPAAEGVSQNITVKIDDADHLLVGHCVEHKETDQLFTIHEVLSIETLSDGYLVGLKIHRRPSTYVTIAAPAGDDLVVYSYKK